MNYFLLMYRHGVNTNILHLKFSRVELIILYKMIIITGISKKKARINHIWNIMSKRHNILPTRTSLFISTIEKIESWQEFKIIKLFESLFHCR